MHIKKICATTWFVFPREDLADDPINSIGTINYPGSGLQEDKTAKYHALRDIKTDDPRQAPCKDLGHFHSVQEAAAAIMRG